MNVQICRVNSEVRSTELATQQLQAMHVQKNKISARMNALETHSTSIPQLRQERLETDTRAENLRLQLKATDRKLQQALRRYVHLGNGKYLG